MNELKEILLGMIVLVYGIMFYIAGRTNFIEKVIIEKLNDFLKSNKETHEFEVIDNKTGVYPDCANIALTEEWAKHLIHCDIDTFAITEDGNLILLDDCGNCAFCPADRFTVVFGKGGAK